MLFLSSLIHLLVALALVDRVCSLGSFFFFDVKFEVWITGEILNLNESSKQWLIFDTVLVIRDLLHSARVVFYVELLNFWAGHRLNNSTSTLQIFLFASQEFSLLLNRTTLRCLFFSFPSRWIFWIEIFVNFRGGKKNFHIESKISEISKFSQVHLNMQMIYRLHPLTESISSCNFTRFSWPMYSVKPHQSERYHCTEALPLCKI